MNYDAVYLGAIATVVVSCVIVAFLAVKITQLIKKDEEKNR